MATLTLRAALSGAMNSQIWPGDQVLAMSNLTRRGGVQERAYGWTCVPGGAREGRRGVSGGRWAETGGEGAVDAPLNVGGGVGGMQEG